MTLDNGIRCETYRDRRGGYLGRIAVYEQGTRLYCVTGRVLRLSRGDAMQDARRMAHDLTVQQFLHPSSSLKGA